MILQRTNATTKIFYQYNQNATTNSFFLNKIRMLERMIPQRTKATTKSFYQYNQDTTTNDLTKNECYNEQLF